MDVDWSKTFFPLPEFLTSYSFIYDPSNATETDTFVAFLSYPVTDNSLSNPNYNADIVGFQIV